MKRLAILLALAMLLGPLAWAEETKTEAYEGNPSSWVISAGAGVGQEPAEYFDVGTGWYLGLETPAVASSWTIALNYMDLGSRFGTVGARRYTGPENTWIWVGFGVGVAKIKGEYENYAPGAYVEAGLAWELSDHLGWEVAGQVGGWRASDYSAESYWKRCRYSCTQLQEDAWEIVPTIRTGLSIAF